MAIDAGELNTAEVALAACEEVDKLQYMMHIKGIPTREGRSAELLLYKKQPQQAESILLQVTGSLWVKHNLQPHRLGLKQQQGTGPCWCRRRTPSLWVAGGDCLAPGEGPPLTTGGTERQL